MRNVILACAVAVAALTGCSKKPEPVVMTPELEAEQKQVQKEVNDLEGARKKNEKPEKSHQQNVDDQERARPKR
jgi:hypothetical protein